MSKKKNQKFKIIYSFDPTIANWDDRLASAFGLVFKKIEEMEIKKYGQNIKTK